MAALRVAVKGQPVDFIDLGPAVGRVHHTRGPIYGGVIVVAAPPSKRGVSTLSPHRQAQVTAAHARYRERQTCGKPLPLAGGGCARIVGHHNSCRSRKALDEAAAQRRSGVGRWP